LLSRNLLTRAASVISLSPPLCITADEVDRIVEIADGAITDMEKKFGYA
jgi:adenosylmethionine-8-amino-7-oxononanoate aminotransferase